jgi:hypothetical protein
VCCSHSERTIVRLRTLRKTRKENEKIKKKRCKEEGEEKDDIEREGGLEEKRRKKISLSYVRQYRRSK